jgi:hypothetical protein
MNRLLVAAMASCGALLGLCFGAVQAQPPNYLRGGPPPYYRPPPVSPYLDILRGGSPATGYYLGTRSEFDRLATQAQYGSAILGLERRVGELQEAEEDLSPTLPSTGHVAYFNTTSGYFNTGYSPRTTPTTPQQRRPR